MKEKVLLIDGNSIMNRAFYAISGLTNSEGVHTNAVFGFLNILFKNLEDEAATHSVVAFDLKAPTFRHIKYEQYKATRKGMPDELAEQMPIIKQLLKDMNIKTCEKEGFEADDIIGTLATNSIKSGKSVTILSGDRDMLQLATDKIKISIPKTKGGVTATEYYFADDVYEVYGITPKELIEVKGLMGDTSDNIPGIPGIGEKTASQLISKYHTIENVYNNLELLTPRIANKVKEYYELALLSRELGTICIDCDIDILIDDCKINNVFNENAYITFKKLELRSFYDRFETINIESKNEEVKFNVLEIKDLNTFEDEIKKSKKVAYYIINDGDNIYISLATQSKNVFYSNSINMNITDIKNFIKRLLINKEIIKITHNLKEQLHLLDLELTSEHLQIYDLSLAAYLINPVKETYNIDDISKDFLNETMISSDELIGKGKSRKKLNELNNDILLNYLGKCTNVLFNSYEEVFKQLSEQNMLDLYFNIELPLLYVLKDMEKSGIKVDADGLKAFGKKLDKKIIELEKNIYALAGEEFNINSPKQLGIILFEKIGLTPIKKTKTSYSTAADVLEKLKNKHPIINEVLTYRQYAKLKSTYVEGLFSCIKEDGRIHSTFNQKVTSTGRISSTEPNLQNIPIRLELGREIRKVFIPEKEYVFVDADYSQIELRLLAHLSEDISFIDAFKNNLDIHTLTASQVFHAPFEEVTSLQRSNAKAVNFGIVYGISAFSLSEDLNITRKEAADYIQRYFERYPNVKSFLDKSIEKAKELGYVKTMFNRIRYIPELKSSNFIQRSFGERIAMNTPIQGSAADIIKIAMINVYNQLKIRGLKSRLILQVHDELLIECYKDEVVEVRELLINEMEKAVELKVPLTVDASIGDNWYETK